MSTQHNQTWMRVRIKTKYADIVRKIAAVREESEIDALYHIIDTYWQSQRNVLPSPVIAPSIQIDKHVELIEAIEPATAKLDDIDLDGFE